MGLYTVYVHTSPSGKRYVGITNQRPERRWRNGAGYIENKHFTKAIKKYGWENIRHEIVISEVSKDEACRLEQELIARYRSNEPDYGYNNSSGGENPSFGHRHSEKTKQIMSQKHKGLKMSEEAKEKLRQQGKLRVGEKNNRYGVLGQANKKAKKIDRYTLSGEYIDSFYGACEVQRKLGIASTPKIRDVCDGKRKTAYGYFWRYAEV